MASGSPGRDNEDGEPVEVDLINYSGDFLRTNADYWFGRIGLTEDELKYLLGLYPQTTFGRKYCDFAAPETQYVIYRKLCRWAPGEPSAYPSKWTRRELKPQASTTLAPEKQTTVHTSAVLVNTSDRDLHLQITCSGGVSISISEMEDIE